MANDRFPNSQFTKPQRSLVIGHGALVVLTLTSFALRLCALGRAELWFDEALSANISALSWAEIVAHLQSRPFEHPPFYFLALHPWQLVAGQSEFALRFFSVFWGVLSVPLLYALVRRLADKRAALLTALLATVSPFLVAYSREARMYSLLPFLAMLAILTFRRALERPQQPWWWSVYGLLLVIGTATHYFFAFLGAATALYLLLSWPRRSPGWGWGMAVHLSILLTGAAWLALSPGLRASLPRLAQGEAAFGLAYKLNKIMPTLILGEVSGGTVPPVALFLAFGGWLLALAGAWWSLRGGPLPVRDWRLLSLILIVPLLLALLLPYGALGRHLGYLLLAMLPFMALALIRRQWGWRLLSALVVLLFTAYGLGVQLTKTNGDTGQALAYIDRYGRPGDLLIVTQPAQKPLMDYYNRRGWPVRYLPEPGSDLNAETVERTLTAISQSRDRLWLGPIGPWTADPEQEVERWLAAHAFQVSKTWFPASSSVALYLTAAGGLTDAEIQQPIWGGIILLQQLQTGPRQLAPGEALPLRFSWRSGLDLDHRYAVSLLLVDAQDRVWAERRSEPCSGWCPTDRWTAGQLHQDQHALQIPPGTPPGNYGLRVEWTPLDGGPPLSPEGEGQRVAHNDVVTVTILPPPASASPPADLPHPLTAAFGRAISLRGYDLRPQELRPGETFHLELHWQAGDAPQEAETLLLELKAGGRTAARWQVSPAAEFYPTDRWAPGGYVRGQHDLTVPGNVPPGDYRLTATLLSPAGEQLPLSGERERPLLDGLFHRRERLDGDTLLLAELRLLDRPRRFDLPPVGRPLAATVGQKAHLRGYDLDLSRAHPGGEIRLTLYWQAGGPMVRPFKVFTHLVGATGRPLAQHDAPPGGGCCPADTWAAGEVIVDEHPIPLPADLPPGAYDLVVGLYDEESGQRVPAYDAKGRPLTNRQVPLGSVTIAAPPSRAGEPKFNFDYVYFLPVVFKNR